MGKYASLHAGLLARKGEASPAIPSAAAGPVSYVDAPAPTPTPVERRDIEARSHRSARPAKPVIACEPETDTTCCQGLTGTDLPADPHAGLARHHRAQLRLTAEQKRRLRTLAVQTDWSQQRILSDALDAWLDRISETEMRGCACLRNRDAVSPSR